MLNFVQNFQYYMMFEVIEPNWQLFESNMDTVCSLFSPKKGKGSPYSITEHRVLELIPVLGSQPAGDASHNPAVGCHYFPPGLQLPSQPLRWLLQFCCLVNRGTMGVSSLPKTVTQQRRGCDLNPGLLHLSSTR